MKNIENTGLQVAHKCGKRKSRAQEEHNTFSLKSLISMQQINENNLFSWFSMDFDQRLLRDYWELDNKLDIWDYLLRELVSILITKKSYG